MKIGSRLSGYWKSTSKVEDVLFDSGSIAKANQAKQGTMRAENVLENTAKAETRNYVTIVISLPSDWPRRSEENI